MDQVRDRAVDELLVMRCQAGSPDAFDLLLRRWQRPLWRHARRLTESDDAAWDVMQETWMTVLRQIRRLGDPAWFAAWAHRIVRNKCADHWRRAGRRRRLIETVAGSERPGGDPPEADPGRALAEAMRRLPVDNREVLMLRYGADLNTLEIALVLGIPAGTVKSRLHHARDRLKRILEGADS